VNTIPMCRAYICRKLHFKLKKLGPGDVPRPVLYGVGAILLNFLEYTFWRTRLYHPITVFYDESDSVNKSYQWSSPL